MATPEYTPTIGDYVHYAFGLGVIEEVSPVWVRIGKGWHRIATVEPVTTESIKRRREQSERGVSKDADYSILSDPKRMAAILQDLAYGPKNGAGDDNS